MDIGVLLTDLPREWRPREQLDALLREVEGAQANGFTYLCIGQHFLYGDYTLLQPVPVLARLAGEVDPHVRLVTTVLISPLYHPILLAEELASLDVVSEGRLIVGLGLGYRSEEFDDFGIPFKQRVSRLEEGLALMREIWTRDTVDFHGRYWTLEKARPHIVPWQSPHPPVWLGGHVEAAARRAGRLGDRWTIPPRVELDDAERLLAAFGEEQARRGLAPTRQPFRRDIFVGDDRDSAMRDFRRAAKSRLMHYAAREHEVLSADALERDFEASVRHALVGPPDEVLAQLRAIAQRLPIDPLLIRAGWPGMDRGWLRAYMDRLGREIVPAIREIQPRPLGGP